MKKQKIILLLVGIMLCATLCFAKRISFGDGRYISEEIPQLPAFTAVVAQGDSEVAFVQRPTYNATISGPENLVALTQVYVEKGVLKVEYTRPLHAKGQRRLQIVVTAPQIKAITATGKADVSVLGKLNGETLTLITQDQSSLEVDDVNVSELKAQAFGKSSLEVERIQAAQVTAHVADKAAMELSGQAQQVTLESRSSGVLDAEELQAQNVQAAVYSSGDIAAYAQRKLSATVEGRGSVKYAGRPGELDRKGKIKQIKRKL